MSFQRRPERMKMVARGQGKLAVFPDSFGAVFRGNQANCQFALHSSEGDI